MSADKYAQFIAEQQKKLSVSGTNPVNLIEKKELSDKQKDIAKLAGDEDEIESEDLKKLRDKKDDDKDDDKKSKSKKDDDDEDDDDKKPAFLKKSVKEDMDLGKRNRGNKIIKNAKGRPGHIEAFGKLIGQKHIDDAVTGGDSAAEAENAMNVLYGKKNKKAISNMMKQEEASYISEEESDYLAEMVAKGKLPEIADFHKKAADHALKMRVHHQGMADKSEDVGDHDGFEHHIDRAMRHDYDHEHHLARYDHAVSLKARNQAMKDLKVAKDNAAKARDAKRDWA